MKVVVASKYLRLLRREAEQRDIEFENAPIRFVFEALLVEYNSIRREIEMRLEFAERTTNYLLFLVGAVVSVYQIFGVTDKMPAGLNSPSVYLLLSVIFLYFPVATVGQNIFIATLGEYADYVLAKKLNMLVQSLAARDKFVKDFLDKEEKEFYPWLVGVMHWEDFRKKAQFRKGILVFGLINMLRYAFLSIPSFYFLYTFFATKKVFLWDEWALEEKAIFVFLGVFLLGLVFGAIYANVAYVSYIHKRIVHPSE